MNSISSITFLLIVPFLLMWVLIAWLKYREHLHAHRARAEHEHRHSHRTIHPRHLDARH
jgi:hypothetical protein